MIKQFKTPSSPINRDYSLAIQKKVSKAMQFEVKLPSSRSSSKFIWFKIKLSSPLFTKSIRLAIKLSSWWVQNWNLSYYLTSNFQTVEFKSKFVRLDIKLPTCRVHHQSLFGSRSSFPRPRIITKVHLIQDQAFQAIESTFCWKEESEDFL